MSRAARASATRSRRGSRNAPSSAYHSEYVSSSALLPATLRAAALIGLGLFIMAASFRGCCVGVVKTTPGRVVKLCEKCTEKCVECARYRLAQRAMSAGLSRSISLAYNIRTRRCPAPWRLYLA